MGIVSLMSMIASFLRQGQSLLCTATSTMELILSGGAMGITKALCAIYIAYIQGLLLKQLRIPRAQSRSLLVQGKIST